MPKTKFNQLWVENWLQKELRNKPTRKIAKEIGCSPGAVIYAARILGITIPKRFSYEAYVDKSKIMNEAIHRLYPNGRFGSQTNHWKGGRIKGGSKGKYILVYSPDHPYKTKDGYVMEHRLIMEKFLGHYLQPEETIHHKNGNGSDNRIENLELTTRKGHARIHFDDCKRIETLEAEVARLNSLLAEQVAA